MVDSNGLTVPDPATETPWSSNMNTLDGKRFVRFRFVFYANLNSGALPRVESLKIPFEF
jgi:hypothetical protein